MRERESERVEVGVIRHHHRLGGLRDVPLFLVLDLARRGDDAVPLLHHRNTQSVGIGSPDQTTSSSSSEEGKIIIINITREEPRTAKSVKFI